MALNFYEKVIIKSSLKFPEYVGKIGVVLGASPDQSDSYYSIYFADEGNCVEFPEFDLVSTNEFVRREEIYNDEDRVRIVVKNGKGIIVE